MIIPPWEETDGQDGGKGPTKDNGEDLDNKEGTNASEQEDGNPNHGKRSILPSELKERFEAIRTIGRQRGRASNYDTGKQQDIDNVDATKEGPDGNPSLEDLKRKERVTATELSVAIYSEISKWKNGIAELEAVLAAMDEEDEDEQRGAQVEDVMDRAPPPRVIRFPALPPLVPPEEEEEEEDGSSRERSSSIESGLTLMTDATANTKDQDLK